MKICFRGEYKPLQEGFEILSSVLGFEIEENGVAVQLVKEKDGHTVSVKKGECRISYSSVSGAMRALTRLVYHLKENSINSDLYLHEEEIFKTCGAMIDVSLGATALTVKTWKTYLSYLARMGMNMVMIYTEDMYTLEDYPYFGYMRGAYTPSELSEIVDYAEKLGIELVPCIQTLAHLSKVQRWKANAALFDTASVLLIDDEKTYQLIEKMIANARNIYRTRRIHIGMDEAHGVCLGRYYHIHGPTDRYEALLRHLRRVVDICKKYGFEPMMWSDMFFRLGSKTNDYYDITAKMPENIKEMIPDGLSQVYWDYYHTNANTYEKLILAHQAMGDVVFAGGVWAWTGFAPKYRQTLDSTYPALEMCKKHGIRHVFATVWQSDYSECDLFNALLGLQLYAEFNAGGEVTSERLASAFKIYTDMNANTFLAMDLDDLGDQNPVYDYDAPYSFSELEHCIPVISKQVLYQDILQGLFDKNFSYIDLKTHFTDCYNRLVSLKANDPIENELLKIHTAHAKVIMQKCDIGIRLKASYDSKDKEGLLACLDDLKTLLVSVEELHTLYADRWYRTCKPFSFDERDIRFGGIRARVMRAISRVEAYLEGNIDAIEELEAERLTFENRETPFAHLYYIEKMRKA
jgi:hypothetical protein